MKTNLFRNIKLPLLGRGLGGGLLLLCWPMMLAAQDSNGVKVSNLLVSAGTPSTVTFDVQWSNDHAPEFVWSDTVWVWVDYNQNGKMERLPVIGATLTATSAPDVGKVVEDAGNNQGRWLVGNARDAGAFSATVQLLTALADFFGVCAYASNYPPMGEYLSSTEISFTGTPPYNIVLKDNSGGATTYTENSTFTVPGGYAVQSFTDKTGAPGTFTCIPSTVYDLVASALGFCEGSAGVTFALSGTDSGRNYELYRDGTPEAVATLEGTDSAATFTGTFAGAGVYTAQAIADMGYCPAIMNGSFSVVSNPLPEVPKMDGGGTQCGGTMTITATYGSGGNGIRWIDGYTTASRDVGAGTYYAVTTSAAGCESGSASVTVIIYNGASNGYVPHATCGCASDFQSYGVCVPYGSTLLMRTATGIDHATNSSYEVVSSQAANSAYCRSLPKDCTGVHILSANFCNYCEPYPYVCQLAFYLCEDSSCTKRAWYNVEEGCRNSYTFLVYRK